MSTRSDLKLLAAVLAICAAVSVGSALGNTVIGANNSFTIDNSKTTLSGSTTTWNDTVTLTISNPFDQGLYCDIDH
jgi:hypothetical protein